MFKKIREKLSWEVFEQTLTQTVQRFPLSVAFVIVLFVLTSLLIYIPYEQELIQTVFVRAILTSLFGALIAFSSVLFLESFSVRDKRIIGGTNALVLLVTAGYGLSLPGNLENVSIDTVLLYLLINVLVLISSVWARFASELYTDTYQDTPFYVYNISKLGAVLEAVVLSLAGFMLTSATFASISLLFAVDVSWELYTQAAAFFFVLVAPFYFLSHTPQDTNSKLASLGSNGSFIKFLITYIALPFITIYFAILYAYSIQVLSNFSEWPQGTVSWLVIFFSFFGWGIYVLSYYIKEEKLVRIFRTYFPYILLPQLGMLFYAIVLRIDQFGITINRYLVVAFGIWLVMLCLFYIFSRDKKLAFLPTSLFVMIVVIMIGPWGITASSERSQLNQLERLFEENYILFNGSVISLPENFAEEVSAEDRESISSIIYYLCYTHGCDSMKELYGSSYLTAIHSTEGNYYAPYTQAQGLIQFIALPQTGRITADYESFYSVYNQNSEQEIPIENATTLLRIDSYEQDDAYVRLDGDKVIFDYDGAKTDITEDFVQYLLENDLQSTKFPEDQQVPPFVVETEQYIVTFYLDHMSATVKSELVTSVRLGAIAVIVEK